MTEKNQTLVQIVRRHSTLVLALCWACVGVLLMFLLTQRLLPEAVFKLYPIMAKFVPSIAQMDAVRYFNPIFAKTHASIMFVLIPIIFLSFLFVGVEDSLKNIREKGRA